VSGQFNTPAVLSQEMDPITYYRGCCLDLGTCLDVLGMCRLPCNCRNSNPNRYTGHYL